jgi:hypothetical protein
VSPKDACAVCGRTFLVGEQVHSFVSTEGRHEVCELCAGATAEFGWLPADQEGAEEKLRAGTERKRGLFARLFVRPQDDATGMAPPAPDAAPVADHELATERYDVEAEWDEPESTRDRLKSLFVPRGEAADLPAPEDGAEAQEPSAPEAAAEQEEAAAPAADAPAPAADAPPAPLPDPAGRGMRPRRLQPDLSPTSRFERAIARFNAGEAGRTVAGLTRTLGAPSVSVGDSAGAADEVRITVAWELTWYQWGVDLGDELRPVYELSRGYEVDEIDAAARQWNASAHDGRIVMVAPRRREAADGRPVHR